MKTMCYFGNSLTCLGDSNVARSVTREEHVCTIFCALCCLLENYSVACGGAAVHSI
jgi:hypothetical protein